MFLCMRHASVLALTVSDRQLHDGKSHEYRREGSEELHLLQPNEDAKPYEYDEPYPQDWKEALGIHDEQ